MTTKSNPILKHFEVKHIRIELRSIAKPFEDMAGNLDALLPEGPEKTVALRKLLESMDCVLRAFANS